MRENPNFTKTNSDEFYDSTEILVDRKQSPIRIDKFLMDRLQNVSRNRVENAIRAGTILVNEKIVKPNYKIRPEEIIKVVIPRPPGGNEGVVPEDIPIDIRYEDDDLCIIHKPVGLVVHPGIGNYSGTLVNGLAYHFRDKSLPIMEGNFQDRLGLVHRIDKNTSGLLVVAKNDYTITHLAKQFYDHTVHRRYWALVWGEMEKSEGTIRGHVDRHPRNRLKRTVFPEGDQGKLAITHYKVLEALYYVSLVECRLETGRTHQIRVHMEHVGNPLFNDDRYSGDRVVKGTMYSKYKQFVDNCFKMMPRHALHAKELGFIHPTTGKEMLFTSELPDDFQSVLDKWRKYVNEKRSKREK